MLQQNFSVLQQNSSAEAQKVSELGQRCSAKAQKVSELGQKDAKYKT